MLPLWPRPASHPPGWQESLQTQRGQLRERATERARRRLRGQENEEDRGRRRAQGGTGIDRRRKQGGWDKGDKVMNWWWGTRQKAVHINASCYCVGDKVAVLTKTIRPDFEENMSGWILLNKSPADKWIMLQGVSCSSGSLFKFTLTVVNPLQPMVFQSHLLSLERLENELCRGIRRSQGQK